MNKKSDVDYSRLPNYIFIGIVGIALLVLNYFYFNEHISSNSELINNYSLKEEEMNKTREPAVAGLFYPADVYQLSGMVDGYLNEADSILSPRPHLIVVPHAGYVYSAAVAAKAYKKLLPFQNEIKTVILVGPSHRVALNGAALSSAESFKTPFGLVPVNQKVVNQLIAQPGFSINDAAHAEEHSLEVQLPFLQKILKKFDIVPLVYGDISPQVLAETLQPYLQRNDVLLVFSADLSHYLDYDTAQKVDRQTADQVASGEALASHQSCGATGINTALLLARRFSLQPQMVEMANSGDTSGETDSVVGYGSWVFNKPSEPKKQLTPLEREVENLRAFAGRYAGELYAIAQKSIARAVEDKHYHPSRQDYADALFDKGAAFVTLHRNGSLRGCIGSLIPSRAVALDVAANAYAAAQEDDRFEPLTAAELNGLQISISLLTGFEEIRFENEADLLRQINSGTDGLVIRDGDRQGLFLPSVWEELPDKQEFMNHLKIKAGLSPSYWSQQLKVYRFRVVEIKHNEN